MQRTFFVAYRGIHTSTEWVKQRHKAPKIAWAVHRQDWLGANLPDEIKG
jgi:hypothetical protein